jgi:hypothetical protein
MEYWANNNRAILKDETTKNLSLQKIKYFRPLFHYSSIPSFNVFGYFPHPGKG